MRGGRLDVPELVFGIYPRFLLPLTRKDTACYALTFDQAYAIAEDAAEVAIARMGITTKDSIEAPLDTILMKSSSQGPKAMLSR
jgi:hypothetical protein